MGKIHRYSTGEAQNIALGQKGSIYSDGTSITSISDGVITAIQMLEDTTFTTLTPATSDFLEVASTGYESKGDTLANSDTFPQGMTIFGRWTTVDVNSGKIVAYVG